MITPVREQMAQEIGERQLADDAVTLLRGHHWPGNARELRNALIRAAARTDESTLCASHFCLEGTCEPVRRTPQRLDQLPTAQLMQLVEQQAGNVAAAARELGVPRSSLRDRLKRAAS